VSNQKPHNQQEPYENKSKSCTLPANNKQSRKIALQQKHKLHTTFNHPQSSHFLLSTVDYIVPSLRVSSHHQLPQPNSFQLGVKCLRVTWFGGLQLLVPVSRNQIKTSSSFGIGNF